MRSNNSVMARVGLIATLLVATFFGGCGGGSTGTTTAGGGGTVTTVPAAPTNVAAWCGNMKVSVLWTAVTGATSYDVYRSTATGVAGTLLGSSTTTSYVDTTGTLGATYYYTVKAVNSIGASAASLEVNDAFYKLVGGAMQGASLTLGGNVITYAGSSGLIGLVDGVGTAAKFNLPFGLTTDGSNVYVADYSNNVIRKIDPVTQAVSVFAGSSTGLRGSADGVGTAATFFGPYGITSDGTNLYVTDNNNCTIRKIDIATATVSTFAGTVPASGLCVSPSVDGTGTAASFNYPKGITTDGTSLYVIENSVVRRINIATRAVTSFAGSTAVVAGHVDAIGTAARFNNLEGITTDGTSLFVTDRYYQDIRKIDIATASVSSLAGNYTNPTTSTSTNGTGVNATFNLPMGITTDGTNLYVTESSGGVTGGGYVVRKIANGTTAAAGAGVVTTLAGNPGVPGITDGLGAAALFRSLWGITIYCGNLIIVDSGNSSIRVLY